MGSCNSAFCAGQQNRQTVRHHDRTGDTGLTRDASVRNTWGHTISMSQAGHGVPMHLLQEHRLGLKVRR
jgi:hypothetical protein